MFNIRGFSIIELMVATAILGIGSSLAYTQISNMKKMAAKLQLRRQIADLRESIMLATNCQSTLAPFTQDDGSISCSGAIDLRDSDGVNFTQSTINNFQVSASCSNTGLTVLATSATGAKDPITRVPLNHSNTWLNPLVGRGSAYSLCANFFNKTKRVRVFQVLSSELPFTSTECTSLLTQNVESVPTHLTRAIYEQRIQTGSADYLLVNTMSDRCSNYCAASPRFYVSGYLSNCTTSEATCVCFR
jgi:prepilin-type N-terminal cleavage/methylation domain-containing protein